MHAFLQDNIWEEAEEAEPVLEPGELEDPDDAEKDGFAALTSLEEVLTLKQDLEKLEEELKDNPTDATGEARTVKDRSADETNGDHAGPAGLGQILGAVDMTASCFDWSLASSDYIWLPLLDVLTSYDQFTPVYNEK